MKFNTCARYNCLFISLWEMEITTKISAKYIAFLLLLKSVEYCFKREKEKCCV